MAKKPDQPLEIERHEQFARCLAAGNGLLVCYFGVGYPRDLEAAKQLAGLPEIRRRAIEYHKILKPFAEKEYQHPV